MSAAKPDLLLTTALQVLNPSSDSREGDEVRTGSWRVQGKRGGGFGSQKRECIEGATRTGRDVGDAGTYFALFLLAVRTLWTIREIPPHFARHPVFGVSFRLYPTDPKVLLANDCCKTGVFARRSTVQYARARNGVFANKNSGDKGMAGWHYRSRPYADLGREQRSSKQ